MDAKKPLDFFHDSLFQHLDQVISGKAESSDPLALFTLLLGNLKADSLASGPLADRAASLAWRACRERKAEFIPLLLAAGFDCDYERPNENSSAPPYYPALWAAEAGCPKALEIFIAAGAKLNRRHVANDTPMTAAARNGHADCAKVLIAAGASLISGYAPPWELAIQYGNANVLEVFLDAGLPIESFDQSRTPLSYAAHVGPDEHCLRLLLARGANVNQPDIVGLTPLMRAAAEGLDDRCAVLIEAGADPSLRKQPTATPTNLSHLDGATAAKLAANKGNRPLAQRLAALELAQAEAFELASASSAPSRSSPPPRI